MKRPFALLGLLVLTASIGSGQVQPAFAPPSLDESKAEFTALPTQIFQANGRYPDSNVILFLNGCDTKSTPPKQLDSSGTYTIYFSGSTLTYSNVQPAPCTLSFDLKGISVPPGVVVATVKDDQKLIGHAFLHFADPHAGPTPAGIQSVDVLWGLISHRVCSDAFGRSVANKFYCIGLKIGNNSGYSLQLAGVGFNTKYDYQSNSATTDVCSTHDSTNYCTKTPASSYALTRAVSQSGSGDWQYITSDSIKALGLVMVGFAPYYHSALGSARYGTANAIVSGPLQKAWDLLFPDQRQQHSNNLDDQALREGKLIPNNSQVSTVVFLDRGSVTLNYKPGCDAMFASYLGRNETLDILTDWRKLSALNIRDKIQEATIGQQESGKKSGGGHDKNTKSPDYRSPAGQYTDCVNGLTSSGIKAALGDLIVVGDKIQYLERIVVDQATHPESPAVPAAPTLTAQPKVTPSAADSQKFELPLEGTDLDKLGDTLIVDTGAPLKRQPGNTATRATYDVTADQAKSGFTINSTQAQTELKLGKDVKLKVNPFPVSSAPAPQPSTGSSQPPKPTTSIPPDAKDKKK